MDHVRTVGRVQTLWTATCVSAHLGIQIYNVRQVRVLNSSKQFDTLEQILHKFAFLCLMILIDLSDTNLCYVFRGLINSLVCWFDLSDAVILNWPDFIVDIDECASGPCQNSGTCTDLVNGYLCQCAPGYTDLQCQTGEGVNWLNLQFNTLWICRRFAHRVSAVGYCRRRNWGPLCWWPRAVIVAL